MNKITLSGNLVADPLQYGDDKKRTEFKIAVDRKRKVNDQKVTDFFRIKAWGVIGENCFKYLAKGRKVLVVGELQGSMYTDREGQPRLALDVIAEDVEFLTPKSDQDPVPVKPKKQITEADFTDLTTEDIPF